MAFTMYGDTAQTYWQRITLMRSMMRAQVVAPRYWYETMEMYYMNNALYDGIQMQLHENAIWTPAMKSLRNPVNRAVEFHVSKLWPGPLKTALPIITDHEKILPAIGKIWEWSNWGPMKQVAARQLATFGDLFIKVAQKRENDVVTRVYLDPIRPVNVTEFDLDERGFVTYIRFDVPNGEETFTEVWSKTYGGYRVWRHRKGLDVTVDELGPADDTQNFDQLGFDFIPVVHAKFRDIGQTRGVSCFIHAMDKIDEANRQATRLHQILFRYNKPTQAVSANDKDSSGRPLPPPTITSGSTATTELGEVVAGDDDLWMLPGMSRLEQMVPQLNYADALAILNAQMEEISKDLPEVLYYELDDRGEMSGVALKIMLSSAIDRVIEARGNAEPALVRAQQMALTFGRVHGLFDESIGTFEAGDYEHSFADRDVIATTKQERAATIQSETQAGVPLVTSMRHNGFSDEEIDDMMNSHEYSLYLFQKSMEIAKTATEAGVPLETVLTRLGWTPEQLETMGTQRLASIALEQEDVIPDVEQ